MEELPFCLLYPRRAEHFHFRLRRYNSLRGRDEDEPEVSARRRGRDRCRGLRVRGFTKLRLQSVPQPLSITLSRMPNLNAHTRHSMRF